MYSYILAILQRLFGTVNRTNPEIEKRVNKIVNKVSLYN